MLLKILFVALVFTSCADTHLPAQKPKKKPAILVKQTGALFSGEFEGANGGKNTTISLKPNGSKLSGHLNMDGETATITGEIKDANATGKITEVASGKSYVFNAIRKANDLHFSMVFPEFNNQTVSLILNKVVSVNKVTNNKNRDQKLIGTWRNTEVISSGSGQFYSSFSTNYFLKLNADGSALSWTGKSAGGTKDVTIDGDNHSALLKLEWYTNGKSLILANPANRKESQAIYYAEPSRMMLSYGKENKVYQRVN